MTADNDIAMAEKVSKVWGMAGHRLEVSDGADISGWSEPAANNAPAEDEAIEAVFRMNQKHILPARNY